MTKNEIRELQALFGQACELIRKNAAPQIADFSRRNGQTDKAVVYSSARHPFMVAIKRIPSNANQNERVVLIGKKQEGSEPKWFARRMVKDTVFPIVAGSQALKEMRSIVATRLTR